jgi:acyl dehydratase
VQFSELSVGQILEAGPREVTEDEIITFARRYDPQPFHTDPVRAKASRWGGLIASGWMTCSIAMELLVRGILEGSESYGSPGVEAVEWTHPVRPGDALRLRATVLDLRVSSSKHTGIARIRWELFNQHGVLVLRLVGTSLFAVE